MPYKYSIPNICLLLIPVRQDHGFSPLARFTLLTGIWEYKFTISAMNHVVVIRTRGTGTRTIHVCRRQRVWLSIRAKHSLILLALLSRTIGQSYCILLRSLHQWKHTKFCHGYTNLHPFVSQGDRTNSWMVMPIQSADVALPVENVDFEDNSNNSRYSSSLRYLRWHSTADSRNPTFFSPDPQKLELQTRVTTFQRCSSVVRTTTPKTHVGATSLLPEPQQQQEQVLETIQLHGQFHFADQKEYYEYYTCDANVKDNDAIFYELLVDEAQLQYEVSDVDTATSTDSDAVLSQSKPFIDHPTTTQPLTSWRNTNKYMKRKLKPNTVLQASSADEKLAQQYNWCCQVNCMPYNNMNINDITDCGYKTLNNKWYHADFTRQEFLSELSQQQQSTPSMCMSDNVGNKNTMTNRNQPLWQQARSVGGDSTKENGGMVLDATTALLVGPPLIVQQPQYQRQQSRRIFTNLFLPGDTIAVWLRYILWITVPCPELSILLIDWSSVWGGTTTPLSTDQGKYYSSLNNNKGRISSIAIPIVQALSSGRFVDVRRLVFGQVAMNGHHQATLSATMTESNKKVGNLLLITKRNDHALTQVFAELERFNVDQHATQTQNRTCTISLLYGCNHCPDIHMKLVQAGFQPTESQWRTAWSVTTATTQSVTQSTNNASKSPTSENFNGTKTISFLVLFLLPMYFIIGGYDWMAAIFDVAQALENSDNLGSPLTILLLYVARHVLLYLSLSKFVLDGDSSDVRYW
jgi:hypothetical protein